MGEHRAEIVGDEAITAVTTPETWGEAMAALLTEVKAGRPADGMVAAVEMIGAVLAEHFPQEQRRHQRNPRQADRAMSGERTSRVGRQIYPRRPRRARGNMSSAAAASTRSSSSPSMTARWSWSSSRACRWAAQMPRAARRPGRRRGRQAAVEDTAIKELEEETGFTAERIEVLGEFFSSPGMVAEGFTLVRAHGLRRIGEGGGNEHEEIEVHLVAARRHSGLRRAEARRRLRDRRQAAVAARRRTSSADSLSSTPVRRLSKSLRRGSGQCR